VHALQQEESPVSANACSVAMQSSVRCVLCLQQPSASRFLAVLFDAYSSVSSSTCYLVLQCPLYLNTHPSQSPCWTGCHETTGIYLHPVQTLPIVIAYTYWLDYRNQRFLLSSVFRKVFVRLQLHGTFYQDCALSIFSFSGPKAWHSLPDRFHLIESTFSSKKKQHKHFYIITLFSQ